VARPPCLTRTRQVRILSSLIKLAVGTHHQDLVALISRISPISRVVGLISFAPTEPNSANRIVRGKQDGLPRTRASRDRAGLNARRVRGGRFRDALRTAGAIISDDAVQLKTVCPHIERSIGQVKRNTPPRGGTRARTVEFQLPVFHARHGRICI